MVTQACPSMTQRPTRPYRAAEVADDLLGEDLSFNETLAPGSFVFLGTWDEDSWEGHPYLPQSGSIEARATELRQALGPSEGGQRQVHATDTSDDQARRHRTCSCLLRGI